MQSKDCSASVMPGWLNRHNTIRYRSLATAVFLAFEGLSAYAPPIFAANEGNSVNLADTVRPVIEYPGRILESEVIMRGLVPRPVDSGDPHDTLQAIRDFNVTRLEWIYGLTPAFIQNVRALGVSVSGVTNTSTGIPAAGKVENYSILTLDLKPTTAPWMRTLDSRVDWMCINNPLARASTLEALKKQIDLGVRDIQRDDPAANLEALRWGGCFCDYCMAGFRTYLKSMLDAKQLSKLGIAQIDTFNYREYLQARHAPAGDAFNDYPGGDLKRLFREFQLKSTVDFHQWWHGEINRYAGHYVPISSNNSGTQFDGAYQPFDFWIGELQMTNASPEYLAEVSRIVREKGKAQVFTMPLQGTTILTPEWKDIIRDTIATTYALGMHMEAPWDTYLPTPKGIRFFGEASDYADLFAFARGSKEYLDGYVDAAVTGGLLDDDRWQQGIQPVTVFPAFSRIFAVSRVKPGDINAPIVIHLVDWSRTHQSFQISLHPEVLFRGRPVHVTFLSPKPYDKAAENKAFEEKDYTHLLDRTELGGGFQTTFTIPSLKPWGLLIIEPQKKDMDDGVWAPAGSIMVNSGGEMLLKLQSATAGARIRYTDDGRRPTRKANLYTTPIPASRPMEILARAYNRDGDSSDETRLAFGTAVSNLSMQALRNADFIEGLKHWDTAIFPGVASGSRISAEVERSFASGGNAAKIRILQSSAGQPWHLRFAQAVTLPFDTEVLLTGELRTNQKASIRVGIQGVADPYASICAQTYQVAPEVPCHFELTGMNNASALDAAFQVDMGLCPAGTVVRLSNPCLKITPK